MNLPSDAIYLISHLKNSGWEAYVVGGCVRDALLGKEPADWDLCTNAPPEEICRCFAHLPLVKTGIKHGTITVLLHGAPYEITTFRKDGPYTDHRRPDTVFFISNLTEDLRRRDFTINAMAYSPDTGLIDPFHGKEDLSSGCLRCVGIPQERFQEDALRILRALRFSSVYSFSLAKDTSAAVEQFACLLSQVAPERIYAEFCRLLQGKNAPSVLLRYPLVLGVFLPEILPAINFNQHSPWHDRDIWTHTVDALSFAPCEDLTLRLAILFHDLGKPSVFTQEEDGTGHFYGHSRVSQLLANQALLRLRSDRKRRDAVCLLVGRHDPPLVPSRPALLRLLNRFGEPLLRKLILLQRCDLSALAPGKGDATLQQLNTVTCLLDTLLREKSCFSLRDLAISGKDLIEIGIEPGPAMGTLLHQLLTAVQDGTLPNQKEILLNAVSTELSSSC